MIDVLIVGAGPAGLALACDLRRQEISFRLIENVPALPAGGMSAQMRSFELFENLADEVCANHSPYPPIRVYQGTYPMVDHIMAPMHDAISDIPCPDIVTEPRWKAEAPQRRRLAEMSGRVEFGASLQDLEQTGESVVVRIRTPAGEEAVTARYLVATDGERGAVQRAIDVPLDGEDARMDCLLIAEAKIEGLDCNFRYVWTTPAGQEITLCPLPATNRFQFAALVTEAAEPALELETLQAMLDEASGSPHESSERACYRVCDVSWISLFRPNLRMTSQFRHGRVFVIGDTAPP